MHKVHVMRQAGEDRALCGRRISILINWYTAQWVLGLAHLWLCRSCVLSGRPSTGAVL